MRRHSFLVHIHPGEVSTLENLRTRERLPIDDLADVGAQIERWVSEALAGHAGAGESGPGARGSGRVQGGAALTSDAERVRGRADRHRGER